MSEGQYREQLQLRRLFGPHAVLIGTAGSGRGPGRVEIKVNGRRVGIGRSFAEALRDAIRSQAETLLPTGDVCLD